MGNKKDDKNRDKKGAGSPDYNLPNSLLTDKRVTNFRKVIKKFELRDVLIHLIRMSYPSTLPTQRQADFNKTNKVSVSYAHRPLGVVLSDYAERIYIDSRYDAISGYFLDNIQPHLASAIAYPLMLQLVEEYFINVSPSSIIHSDMIMMMMLVFKDMIMAALQANNSLRAQELLTWFPAAIESITNRNSATIYKNVREWVHVYDSLINRQRSLNLVNDNNLLLRPFQSRPPRPARTPRRPPTARKATAGISAGQSVGTSAGPSTSAGPQSQADLCWTLGTGASTSQAARSHPPIRLKQPAVPAPSTTVTHPVPIVPKPPATTVQLQPVQQPTTYYVVQPAQALTQSQIPGTSQQTQVPILLIGPPINPVANLTTVDLLQPILLIPQPQQNLPQQSTLVPPSTVVQLSATQTVVPPTLVLREPSPTEVSDSTSHQSIQAHTSEISSTSTPTLILRHPDGKRVQKPLSVQTTSVPTATVTSFALGQQTTGTVTTTSHEPLSTATSHIMRSELLQTRNLEKTQGYTGEYLQSLADDIGLRLSNWYLNDPRVTSQDPAEFITEEIIHYIIQSRLPDLPDHVHQTLQNLMTPADLSGTRLGVALEDYMSAITNSIIFNDLLNEFDSLHTSDSDEEQVLEDFLVERILPPCEIIQFDRMMAGLLLTLVVSLRSLQNEDVDTAMRVMRSLSEALEIPDSRRDIVRNGWALMQGGRDDLINRTQFDLSNSIGTDGAVEILFGSEANYDLRDQMAPYLFGSEISPITSPSKTKDPCTGSRAAVVHVDGVRYYTPPVEASSPMKQTLNRGTAKRTERSDEGPSQSSRSAEKSKSKGSGSKDDRRKEKAPMKKKSRTVANQANKSADCNTSPTNYYIEALIREGIIPRQDAHAQEAILANIAISVNQARYQDSEEKKSSNKATTSEMPDAGTSNASADQSSEHESQLEKDMQSIDELFQNDGDIPEEFQAIGDSILEDLLFGGEDIINLVSLFDETNANSGATVGESSSCSNSTAQIYSAQSSSTPAPTPTTHVLASQPPVPGNSPSAAAASKPLTGSTRGSTSGYPSGRNQDGGESSCSSDEEPTSPNRQAKSSQAKKTKKKGKKPKKSERARSCVNPDAPSTSRQKSDDGSSGEEARIQAAILESLMFSNP